MNTVLIVDELP